MPPNSASGYCLIEAGGNAYYSDYIIGNSDAPQIKSFLLRLESSQLVTFTVRWGIYNRDGDVIDGVLTIGDNSILEGIEAPADETEAPADEPEAPADETEPPADETEPPADETEPPADETEAPADETEAPADETEPPTETNENIAE